MNLGDLIDDQRTSLTEEIKRLIDQPAFRRDLRHLEQYGFWSDQRRRPSLWDHQRAAIGTVVAYLRAEKAIPERPEHTEAALLKLPTGTGKSGVIAVIARCLPEVRKVLVLTPREALTKQLLRDIRFRFWKNIGYAVDDGRYLQLRPRRWGLHSKPLIRKRSFLANAPLLPRILMVPIGSYSSARTKP